MPRQLHGYEDNLSAKGSALREVTVSKQGDKAALDVGATLYDSSGNLITPSNPLPVTNTTSISTDLEGGGKISVGTSAVEVTFSGTTETIIITADHDNSGILYVGKSNVLTDGSNAIVPLLPGESVTLDYEDSSNAVYVVGSAVSQNFWKGATL